MHIENKIIELMQNQVMSYRINIFMFICVVAIHEWVLIGLQ